MNISKHRGSGLITRTHESSYKPPEVGLVDKFSRKVNRKLVLVGRAVCANPNIVCYRTL